MSTPPTAPPPPSAPEGMPPPPPSAAPGAVPPAPYGYAPPRSSSWGAGRVIAVIVGALVVLLSAGLLLGGGAVLWADQTQRTDGYLTSGDVRLQTSTYAVVSDRIDLGAAPGQDWITPSRVLGTVRFRVQSDTGKPVFVGVAREDDAKAYLAGAGYDSVRDFSNGGASYRRHAGSTAPAAPTSTSIWVRSTSGTGSQTLTWKPTGGHWMVVVMNADASPGVDATADAGATVPSLGWIAAGLLIVGALLLIGGAVIIVVAVATARPKSPAPLPPR